MRREDVVQPPPHSRADDTPAPSDDAVACDERRCQGDGTDDLPSAHQGSPARGAAITAGLQAEKTSGEEKGYIN